MTRTLDGFALDIPPVNSQIIALAQRKHFYDDVQEQDAKQHVEFLQSI